MRVPFTRFILTTLAFIVWHVVRGAHELLILNKNDWARSASYEADRKEIWQDYLDANVRNRT